MNDSLEKILKKHGLTPVVEQAIQHYINDEEYLRFTVNTANLTAEYSLQVPSAAVAFSMEEGDETNSPVRFMFNPDFWAGLTYSEKCFVYGHEVFHILFDHGRRGREFAAELEIQGKKVDHDRLNKAMDICINELQMREHFSHLTLEDMPTVAKGCFISTCFPGNDTILRGKGFEYYYEMLELHGGGEGEGFDEVDFETEIGKALADILDQIQGKESSGTKPAPGTGKSEDAKDGITEENYSEKKAESDKAGNGSGYSQSSDMMTTEVTLQNTPEVNSLAEGITLIRKYFSGRSTTYKTSYDWTRQNRRMYGMPRTCFIPNRDEVKKVTRQKIIIYADVSGSVSAYSERFIRLAIDLDKNIFDFELIPWASYCGKVEVKGQRAVFHDCGYGTVIENVISDFKKRTANGERFDSVLCLTDGEYSNIAGRDEDFFAKWTFFMTTSSKNAPKKSNIIRLKGF